MTLSLIGFRDYRAAVKRLLTAAKLNPRAIPDRAIIAAWLAEQPATQFVQQFQRGQGKGGAR